MANFLTALRIGYAVLSALAEHNVSIKGVPTAQVLAGVNAALTTEQTIAQVVQAAKVSKGR